MIGWIERLFQPKPDVMDDLLKLADGDVDLLRDSIRLAANGAESADLEKVVTAIVEQRGKRQQRAAV